MKRIFSLLLILALLLALAACGGTAEGATEITISAVLAEQIDESGLCDDHEGQRNTNGTVTYTLSESQRRALLRDLKAEADRIAADMLEGEAQIEAFERIHYNDHMNKVDIAVSLDHYTEEAHAHASDFYMVCICYQVFSGMSSEEIFVEVNFRDPVTRLIHHRAPYTGELGEFEANKVGGSAHQSETES